MNISTYRDTVKLYLNYFQSAAKNTNDPNIFDMTNIDATVFQLLAVVAALEVKFPISERLHDDD